MRIIFMGTPEFSVPVLEALIDSRHEVVAVVTQPDKPKGRGKAMQFTPVKETALANGIPVLQPQKVRVPEVVEQLRSYKPDLIAVVAFGQILPKSILEMPKFGCVNVHASLLPKYRGAAPIQWAVINGEKESGVTTMMMARGIDTGDMLLKRSVELAEDETGDSLHDKLAAIGGPLLLETIDGLEQGTVARIPQDESQSSHVGMLTKQMGKIDWTKPAVALERLIRGLNSWPSAYTSLNGKTVKIWSADVVEADEGQPGEVIAADKTKLVVKTGEQALSIRIIQPEGKKRMEIDAFLRGYEVKLHDRFE
ncbi:MAG: methionyl-tRNA formyltransferase [Lachnospiraceae bacterium]|nr:methionyl-tRNA formyltransferase [Lachnospiraceae bacterium]